MFVLRQVQSGDVEAVLRLARLLNTLNLPPERDFIARLVDDAVRAFEGGSDEDARASFDPTRRFLFVLESPEGEVVGSSMIFAQHGTPDEPHVFFEVDEEERFARMQVGDQTREVHMEHQLLRLGMTYRGPTEVGGLVLDPAFRGHPHKLGRLLSLARFLYIARHRTWFRDRVLAELLPPLYAGADGNTRSPLWDVLGANFTGLTYAEADALSRDDKGFIWQLFPQTPIHTTLLPQRVREIVGRVGDASRGAQRLLESIGFADSGRVDPFDGGPHFEAEVEELSLVRELRPFRPEVAELGPEVLGAVVCSEGEGGFRAVWTAVAPTPGDFDEGGHLRSVRLRANAIAALGDPERVWLALRPELREREVPWRLSGG